MTEEAHRDAAGHARRAAEFSIPVADIDAGGKPFEFPIRPAWVRGALEDAESTTSGKPGSLAVRVSRSGHDIVVHGRLECELEAPCARCLKPTPFVVAETLSLLFMPAAELKKREMAAEAEMAPGDADTFPYQGETVVLDDVVRDELLLETPMIPLCSEDCPGIRPAEDGAAKPQEPSSGDKVDPRLAPLLRFRTTSKE
ncbi:MAG: DUF177 domain-containing protein [Myxococcales bacterium]|nr:DUF177 domain-containing protein [Myxococcales bacterium]